MWRADGKAVEVTCTVWQMHVEEADGEDEAQDSNALRRHLAITWAMDDCLEVPVFPGGHLEVSVEVPLQRGC